MPISFNCPRCGLNLSAPDEYAGGSAKCKKCQEHIRIPKATEVKPSGVNMAAIIPAEAASPSAMPSSSLSGEFEAEARSSRLPWIIIGCMMLVAVGILLGVLLTRTTQVEDMRIVRTDELESAPAQYEGMTSPPRTSKMTRDRYASTPSANVTEAEETGIDPDDSVNQNNEDCFAIWDSEQPRRFGMMNRNGEALSELILSKIPNFSEGLAAVESAGRIGFINCDGQWVIPPRYDTDDGAWQRYARFVEGLVLVKEKGSFQYVNRAGCTVIEGRFIVAEPFQNNIAYVWKLGSNGDSMEFIDHDGRTVVRIPDGFVPLLSQASGPYAEWTIAFNEGMLPVSGGGECGYLDRDGHLAIPLQFDNAAGFSEGLAAVRIGDKYGFVDNSGSLRIDARFEDAQCFRDGRAAVKLSGKWGFVNVNGDFEVEPKYTHVYTFSEGRAAVTLGNPDLGFLWSFIDRDGKSIVDTATNVLPYRGGIAMFYPYGNVDRDGRLVWIAPDFRHLDATSLQW